MNKNTMSNIIKLSNEIKELEPLALHRNLEQRYYDSCDIENAIIKEIAKENEYKDWCVQFLKDLLNNKFYYLWRELVQNKIIMLEEKSNGCKYSGLITDDSYECGTNYWIFEGSMSDDDIRKALENMGIFEYNDRGIYDDMDWDCSGKCLASEPRIQKRTKTRVLVTQGWSHDV